MEPQVPEVALWVQARGRWGRLGSLGLDLPREPPLHSTGTLTPCEPPVAVMPHMPVLVFVLFCLAFFYFGVKNT